MKDADDKSPFKYEGLQTFQWSPKDNIIAVWAEEKGNNPARLVLLDVPRQREIAARSRTQVEAQMVWQSEGDYLALLVTKLGGGKTKKKGATNLEIFRIREKDIPVDIIEVKDAVRGFFWETRGRRFAVLTADEQGHHPKLLLYALADKDAKRTASSAPRKGELDPGNEKKNEHICTFGLPSNQFNQVFWAPDGQYFVIAAVRSANAELLFCSLSPDNKFEILHKDEHYMLTDVQWDPSSRYVITAVTQPINNEIGGLKFQMEAGFCIWTFQGRALFRQQREKLFYIYWRPNPPSLLDDAHRAKIRKDIKDYSKKYNNLDDKAKESARNAFKQDRDEKTEEFNEILERLHAYKLEKYSSTAEHFKDAWTEHYARVDWKEKDELIEEELETIEETLET
eukprot:NODE_1530_length_2447_cov_7.586207.p1 GENE.NODE_1530_length_2447_cov_7.586207~~NODE_1530_length_2447_cov_7.586207.p1  ORF type:complete len:397 (+),score=140.77 NODE_1530_length_2447_cov_7.586207:1085-2275(+)